MLSLSRSDDEPSDSVCFPVVISCQNNCVNESVRAASPSSDIPLALGGDCHPDRGLRPPCFRCGDGGSWDDAGPESQSSRLRHSRWRDPVAKSRPHCGRRLANSFAESPQDAGLKPASWRGSHGHPPPQSRSRFAAGALSRRNLVSVCMYGERVDAVHTFVARTRGLVNLRPHARSRGRYWHTS